MHDRGDARDLAVDLLDRTLEAAEVAVAQLAEALEQARRGRVERLLQLRSDCVDLLAAQQFAHLLLGLLRRVFEPHETAAHLGVLEALRQRLHRDFDAAGLLLQRFDRGLLAVALGELVDCRARLGDRGEHLLDTRAQLAGVRDRFLHARERGAGLVAAAVHGGAQLAERAGELGGLARDVHQGLAVHLDGLGEVVDLLVLALQQQQDVLEFLARGRSALLVGTLRLDQVLHVGAQRGGVGRTGIADALLEPADVTADEGDSDHHGAQDQQRRGLHPVGGQVRRGASGAQPDSRRHAQRAGDQRERAARGRHRAMVSRRAVPSARRGLDFISGGADLIGLEVRMLCVGILSFEFVRRFAVVQMRVRTQQLLEPFGGVVDVVQEVGQLGGCILRLDLVLHLRHPRPGPRSAGRGQQMKRACCNVRHRPRKPRAIG